MATQATASYPVTFDVEYPERLSRLTTLLRLIWAIPILILVSVAGNATLLAPLLLIVFRKKYPRWMFEWNLALTQLGARFGVYALLLRDEYPSSDEEQAVHLNIEYPDVERDLNRWLPLLKFWLLLIPHYIVLILLAIIAAVLTIVAWFAFLITGRYPRGIFEFVVGVMRWGYRVYSYGWLLTTDRYPPFSLK